jgi:hypothetical protein
MRPSNDKVQDEYTYFYTVWSLASRSQLSSLLLTHSKRINCSKLSHAFLSSAAQRTLMWPPRSTVSSPRLASPLPTKKSKSSLNLPRARPRTPLQLILILRIRFYSPRPPILPIKEVGRAVSRTRIFDNPPSRYGLPKTLKTSKHFDVFV